MLNVDPLPGVVSTWICPSDWATILNTVESPKPRALSGCLGREEGVEDAHPCRLVHTGARVGDGDPNERAGAEIGVGPSRVGRRDVVNRDGQLPAVRHRVASVDGEIDDDLLELGGIDPNPAVLGVEVQLDLDVVADERPGLE